MLLTILPVVLDLIIIVLFFLLQYLLINLLSSFSFGRLITISDDFPVGFSLAARGFPAGKSSFFYFFFRVILINYCHFLKFWLLSVLMCFCIIAEGYKLVLFLKKKNLKGICTGKLIQGSWNPGLVTSLHNFLASYSYICFWQVKSLEVQRGSHKLKHDRFLDEFQQKYRLKFDFDSMFFMIFPLLLHRNRGSSCVTPLVWVD